VICAQLQRNHVELVPGTASFLDPHTVCVALEGQSTQRTITAHTVVIATGTVPARPANVKFDGVRVLDSDQILTLEEVPGSMVVVGASVIGVEHASMFAALGTRVTLIEKRDQVLDFCDPEIVESLKFHLRDHTVSFRFGEEVASVESSGGGTSTTLASGKRIAAEVVMHSAGRQGNTSALNLELAGLEADRRGRLAVNGSYQTDVPHIYAVGDVIGFPALAATSMDQGRHEETREILGCTSSARARPSWSTSARRSWAAAARSTTSSTPCSTTRRCRRRTRSRRSTWPTSCGPWPG